MRIILSFFLVGFLLVSCNSSKRAQRQMLSGNFEQAIDIAVSNLQRNKTNRRAQDQMLLLEEAFSKMQLRDKRRVKFLEKERLPVNTVEIYRTYERLNRTQERILPLLPLYHQGQNREMNFQINDYSNQIIEARDNVAEYFYQEALELLSYGDKMSARKAHEDLLELESIRPNYKNTRELINDAFFMGTDFVLVSITNSTNFVIPQPVQELLLDFNTFGLDDRWTQYHNEEEQGLDYDYGIRIDFMNFLFSPDMLREREVKLEDEVVDGWRYAKDGRGNFILDDKGNKVREDIYVTVGGTLFETIQQKSVAVEARVIYRDFKSNQNINTFPLASEFIFENVFGSFQGDARVLNDEQKRLIKNRGVAFPSNERMLIDAGEEIKQNLRTIIYRNRVR